MTVRAETGAARQRHGMGDYAPGRPDGPGAGILTSVDGAHALAQFPFVLRDLQMDYHGVSLHRWLLAPTGTGLLRRV